MYINNNVPPASLRRPYHRSAPPAPRDGLSGSVVPYQPSSLLKGCRFAPGSVVSQQNTLGCERARAPDGTQCASRIWTSRAREGGTASQMLKVQVCIFPFVYIFLFFPLPALYILQVSTEFCFPLVFQGAAASVLSIPANRVEGGARTRSISG